MKIVHANFALCMGGSENLIVDIVNRQAREHDVHLVIVNNKESDYLINKIDPAVKIHRIGRPAGSKNPWYVLKLNYLLHRLKPDVLHLHQAVLLPYIKGKFNFFFTAHCLDAKVPCRQEQIKAIAISEPVAESLKQGNEKIKFIKVIPNGIDYDAIRRIPLAQRKLHDPVRIVCVGRLDYQVKGQDLLIEAVAKLREKGCDNVCVDFLGSDVRDSALRELKELSRRLGVEDIVRFFPEVNRSDIYARLCDYDIMVHPARKEGFGLVIAEGMAAEVPVITADEGGPFSVTDDGRLAAAIYRLGDADSMAEAIKKVIDNYPAALAKIEEARRHVIDNYSIDNMVRQYYKAYTETKTSL